MLDAISASFMWHYDVTDVTSWRHIMSLYHTMAWVFLSGRSNRKILEITFFDLVTLTFDLDHQTHPRFYQGQSLYQILWPYVNQFSCESAHKLTDTHTNGSVLITSTADAGGNNIQMLLEWWDIRMHVHVECMTQVIFMSTNLILIWTLCYAMGTLPEEI